MPWKNELDHLVHQAVLEASRTGAAEDAERALRAVQDLLTLAPGRTESHFLVGVAEELLPAAAGLPAAEGETAGRWRFLGRLDAASRRSKGERIRELMADPHFEGSLPHPEGRIALRAVGRTLLRDGEEERAFDLYRRHLAVVDDEASRRDAEFLLEDALRRADRDDEEGAGTGVLSHLDRAAQFAEAAGLDPRARAKVDRKLGRLHQLEGRWSDAEACYRRALERLPADDPYRSVLTGDLALAMLGVRGTLDLLPVANRQNVESAEQLLRATEGQGEGRSYNALYTLGMLAYERGEFAAAAQMFREADALMRENRAKARIVHARSRFFLAHCLLEGGAEGSDLEEAARWVTRDASAVSLDPEIKERIFDALLARVPGARIPGRPGVRGPREGRPPREGREGREGRGDRDRGGRERGERERPDVGERADAGARPDRGDRGRDRGRDDRGERAAAGGSAAGYLQEARGAIGQDPHRALEMVDRAFKSRPDFETWFGAYRARLDALLVLGERTEALRTYERFRAKLYQREALRELESFLLEPEGPMTKVLDEAGFQEELIDLYEVMPGREGRLVEACLAAARSHLETGEPGRIARAVAILREAAAHDAEAVRPLLEAARDAAARAGVAVGEGSAEEARRRLGGRDAPLRLLLVGGDEGRRPHRDRLRDLAQALGFQGEWVFTGAQPPHKALREIEDMARTAHGILLHHATGPELRDEVKRLGQSLHVPVREAAWLGRQGVEQEVLLALQEMLG